MAQTLQAFPGGIPMQMLNHTRYAIWITLLMAIALTDYHNLWMIVVLILLAAVDLINSVVPALPEYVSVIIRIGLCYLLIGYTHGIDSNGYYALLLTILLMEVNRTYAVTLAIVASLLYMSFLMFVQSSEYMGARLSEIVDAQRPFAFGRIYWECPDAEGTAVNCQE
jgi:hypothetical protein